MWPSAGCPCQHLPVPCNCGPHPSPCVLSIEPQGSGRGSLHPSGLVTVGRGCDTGVENRWAVSRETLSGAGLEMLQKETGSTHR